jgi:hypothetical protein
MPYCPTCRYEYTQGLEICPDCNQRLIDSLPEGSGPNVGTVYEDWVQIGRLTSLQYAELVLGGLRAKDIPAVIISGAGHFGLTGQLSVASYRLVSGDYSLMVPSEYVNDADKEAELILGDVWKSSRSSDS